MAADSDGCADITTLLTCEGNLSDPQFSGRFGQILDKLNGILGDVVKVRKLEPWNSVRVTLSIPREAALRLRKLASEGSAQLRALGILSVQVEGDQVISLRIANSPQEIVLTTQDGAGGTTPEVLGRFLSAPAAASTDSQEKVQFKSPNVVCPSDSVVPKVPVSEGTPKGPFPFASMNQAIHAPPPPPYPGKHPTVTISSPLLVNLLQNDGKSDKVNATTTRTVVPKPVVVTQNGPGGVRTVRTVTKTPLRVNNLEPEVTLNTKKGSPITSQASTSSPSALSNTSIRQSSKPNSTITSNVTQPAYPPPGPPGGATSLVTTSTRNLPPPPPYPINRQWDSVVQTSPFLDLSPSLTDLKADDIEHLLPTLERDLARSPPEIPEELTRDKRNFLINPLTGELEPQSSGESDNEDLGDVFTGLPSPAALSDDDTNSTIRPDTTDQSDSETRSSHSDSGKHSRIKSKVRDRGRDSPGLKPTEKIKLRLKLEKSEPINSAYKVDVSFVQQPKKASTSVVTPGEEPRVPPLHISLRGRHHAFITNKKKAKLNPDKPKTSGKLKKSDGDEEGDQKKLKKLKANHETNSFVQDSDMISKLVIHNSAHYKDKQKERRGSDSELTRASLKFVDSNGIVSVEKKRRLSQSEPGTETPDRLPILGSTNVGTIAGLPQKSRKEKNKLKDGFRNKNFKINEKFSKQVALPTGEIDMEAKFKQRLLEGTEKGIPRPPHRTETVHQIVTESNQIEKSEKTMTAQSEPPPSEEKSPEPDKCNTPNKQAVVVDLGDKQAGRSPNSGAQGEDSGIESMDALSEKSPNQASQSPHDADIIINPEPPAVVANNHNNNSKSKTQVPDMPDMLDIEAQLAKMEGLNGVEDMNENDREEVETPSKQLGQCCELTSALQDSLKQGTVTLSSVNVSPIAHQVKEQMQTADVSLVPVKSKTKEEDLEPLPVRVTPPLYTYSNPEKGSRAGSESPTLSDDDSNSCPSTNMHKTKSLLEQLLIDIPAENNQAPPSSPSPATRSVRTRALSKLGSPELNSPVGVVKQTKTTTTTKRKRHESDSSTNSLEEQMQRNAKKTRKCSENAAELIKACMGVADVGKAANNVKKTTSSSSSATGKVPQDESSDSDEPLIEKVRKTATNNVTKNKVKGGANAAGKGVAVSTRRSVRTAPAPNTRSKGDSKAGTEAEALRRKTRSAVSEGESKRKKEVK